MNPIVIRSRRYVKHASRPARPLIRVHLQRRDERLLRDIDLAELAHLLLALLLLVEELALAGGVAAVAFGGDVLARGADRLAGDDLAAQGGLDGDDEKVGGSAPSLFSTMPRPADTGAFRSRILRSVARSPKGWT